MLLMYDLMKPTIINQRSDAQIYEIKAQQNKVCNAEQIEILGRLLHLHQNFLFVF